MSQENVEIARAAIEDFIAGKTQFDADGTLTRMAGEEHWHPDIELDVSEAVVPEMRGVFRGKEAVRRWWGEWLGAWETVEFEYELPHTVAPGGNYRLTWVRQAGTPSDTLSAVISGRPTAGVSKDRVLSVRRRVGPTGISRWLEDHTPLGAVAP